MKKKLIFASAIVLGLAITSCNKDEDPKVDGKTGEPKEFSQLSVADHKSSMQDMGIEVVNEFDGLATSKGVEASVNMAKLMDGDEIEGIAVAAKVPLTLSQYAHDQIGEKELADLVTSFKKATVEDPMAEQDYKEIAAKYSWNAVSGKWDSTGSANLIIEFPSTEDGNTNNAVFTVEEFDFDFYEDPYDPGYKYEVPVAIKANLKVDGATEIDFSFSGDYSDSEGLPTMISGKLSVSGYTIEGSMNNSNNKEASGEVKFTHNDIQIAKLKAGINGNFSATTIEENTLYYKEYLTQNGYVVEEVTKSEYEAESDRGAWYWSEVNVEAIYESTYGFAEIMNLRVGGSVKIDSLIAAEKKIWYDGYWYDEDYDDVEAYKQWVAALNKYTDMYVSYVNDNKKIADFEFYTYEEEVDITEWRAVDSTYKKCEHYYDETKQEWVYECQEIEYDPLNPYEGYWNYDYGYVATGETETVVQMDGRFIFSDGTKMDAESFFEDALKSFIDALNDMLVDLEDKYDVDLEEIEYPE